MSTEQGVNHSTKDQENEVKGDEVGTQSQTFELGGKQVSWEELMDSYKKLQWEYTKSRQEISENKKNSELSDEDKSAIDFIKKNWFVTKDDLEGLSKKQAHEANLSNIIAANPDLQPFESAIKEIWKNWDIAYEDIIQKYGFKSKDKLTKARSQGDVKWTPQKKEKAIKDMTSEEWAKHKAKMWWSNNTGTFG